ncbi:hypothetical protein K438DRAFT_2003197 [Mycena galopus ATCC 62051]|nr:hypothetical protein K438DRAFT_2003197 [Mycena galopus ATCC 62051]
MDARTRTVGQRFVHSDLPLGAARIVFCFLSFVFSVVGSSLCVKIWTKHHGVQKLLNHNVPSGVSAVLEYQDVKTTSILLFVFNSLLTFTTSHIAIIMVHDIFKIIPPFVLRRMGLPLTTMSSVTLPYQAVALAFQYYWSRRVWRLPHSIRSFPRAAQLRSTREYFPPATIQATLDRLGIVLPYRNVDYIRISAEVQWPAIFFALGANVLTLVALVQIQIRAAGS